MNTETNRYKDRQGVEHELFQEADTGKYYYYKNYDINQTIPDRNNLNNSTNRTITKRYRVYVKPRAPGRPKKEFSIALLSAINNLKNENHNISQIMAILSLDRYTVQRYINRLNNEPLSSL